MDRYVTGEVIKRLRESKRLTQEELAEKICVSSKAVSKWETGRGYPDISLLEPLADALGISVIELLSGNHVTNVTLFPHPDSPTTPTVLPIGTSKVMPSTDLTVPISVKK